MIYVDVTAACLLPLQSGIPRTTRGLYQLLEEALPGEVTPIMWQPFRGCYTRLSSRARALLEDPFHQTRSSSVTRDSTLPLLWASFCDLRFQSKAVPLHQLLGPTDTLLLTSIFPDNRLGYLNWLITFPGRKIAIFHDAIPLRDPNVPRWQKDLHRQAIRLLARMDLVIAVSRSAQEDLHARWLKYRIPAAPTEIIPWPVPFSGVRPAFAPPSRQPRSILYVSRLKQVKNHATLLAACESLWREGVDFQLDLIGCQDEAKESRAIIRSIKHLQSAGRPVSWRGHVSEPELHDAYQRATFTVFPSLMEGFGLPVIESLWHSRPVVCSDQGAVGELTQMGGCITTDVRHAEALTATMHGLLSHEALCLAFSMQAHARPLRSWADYGRDLLPLLAPP